MRVNIWETRKEKITEIGFNKEKHEYVVRVDKDEDGGFINIFDDVGGDVVYYLDEIDDLIKALQTAKELWGDK